jgi:hypothetical protein
MANRSWFPTSREAKYTMVTKTADFMAVAENRVLTGFDPQTL